MTDIAKHRIPAIALEGVNQPIAQANGMPNAAYDDPALFEYERDNVLGKSWAGLAFTSEIPTKGYAKPFDFMGLPILVMRNKQGELNVFHNVCSHRGMVLLEEPTQIEGMLRCPYHSWTYNTDGDLKGTPHIGGIGNHSAEGFSCENHGLRKVRSAIWNGIVFINLSGDAEDFNDFVAPLVERWESFVGTDGYDKLTAGSHAEFLVESNWKLPVENYCEAYHLPWVHPGLNSYSPLDQHYNIVVNEAMSGQGSYTYNLSDVAGTSLPQFQSWPEDKIRQAEYISLYPNVLLGIQADHAFAIILQPTSHKQTLEKLELSYLGDAATNDEYAHCRKSVLESWKEVFTEDIFAVEGMQKGRRSPGFSGGVFSPVLDTPTHNFHQWVSKQYMSDVNS